MQRRDTSHTGVFVTATWRPQPLFNVNAELETGTYNDPFTLASPTGRVRFRVQASVKRSQGAYATGTYVLQRLENDNRPAGALVFSDWQSDRDQLTARVGFRSGERDLSGGYTFVRVHHEVDQTINPGGSAFLIPVLYEADANFADGRIRWPIDDLWRIGGDLRFYDNAGSFAVQRHDLRAYVEVTLLEQYLLHVGYRRINYEEKLYGFNDYDANIIETSVGYAW